LQGESGFYEPGPLETESLPMARVWRESVIKADELSAGRPRAGVHIKRLLRKKFHEETKKSEPGIKATPDRKRTGLTGNGGGFRFQ